MSPVDRARSQLGVPWMHQGRLAGIAIDCVGLLVVAFPGLTDRTNYGRTPVDGQLERLVEEQFGPPVDGPLRPADVVLMVFPDRDKLHKPMRHVGIIGDYQGAGGGLSLIHTWNGGPGCVIETRLDEAWEKRIRKIHRLGELA